MTELDRLIVIPDVSGRVSQYCEIPCPHGIIRGMLVCPTCDPEKQRQAEEHVAEWLARRRGEL